MLSTFDGTWASPRQEWSKGWALTDTAAWAHPRILKHTIPKLYTDGRPPDGDWAWALHRLHALDPHHVFSNGFLRAFLH
jgi:hypothetical protein